ncbi:Adhesin [Gammaproteobacteria bacterium]
MINVTEQAAKQIRQATTTSDAEGLALRIAARQLPDGTLDYGMGFDHPKPGDIIIETYGVTIVVAAQHQAVLNNLVLDYVEFSPHDFHFIFQNPNDPQHGVSNQR